MNEAKIEQILKKIGEADVPADITLLAERTSRNISSVLRIEQSKNQFLAVVRYAAAAAVIILAFAIGRWSTKQEAIDKGYTYDSAKSVYATDGTKTESFWQQKIIAATQPSPYAQTQFNKLRFLSYKQYLMEKNFKKGE